MEEVAKYPQFETLDVLIQLVLASWAVR